MDCVKDCVTGYNIIGTETETTPKRIQNGSQVKSKNATMCKTAVFVNFMANRVGIYLLFHTLSLRNGNK